MYLYLLTQDVNNDWDTYDSLIVAATSYLSAERTLPHTRCTWGSASRRIWAEHPDQVSVKLIGKAEEGVEAGVILASFNAG